MSYNIDESFDVNIQGLTLYYRRLNLSDVSISFLQREPNLLMQTATL
jgi:hypothetical protein